MSDTIAPCTCDHFKWLEDPDFGLKLDEDGRLSTSFPMVLFYCPRCEGKLPNLWHAYISDEDRDYFQELIGSDASVEDVFRKLGPPDYDETYGHHEQDLNGPVRNIEYYHLSPSVNLELYFRKDRLSFGQLMIKGHLWEDEDNVESG